MRYSMTMDALPYGCLHRPPQNAGHVYNDHTSDWIAYIAPPVAEQVEPLYAIWYSKRQVHTWTKHLEVSK